MFHPLTWQKPGCEPGLLNAILYIKEVYHVTK